MQYPDADEWVNRGDSAVIAPGGKIVAGRRPARRGSAPALLLLGASVPLLSHGTIARPPQTRETFASAHRAAFVRRFETLTTVTSAGNR
jgi:hypothetical protein